MSLADMDKDGDLDALVTTSISNTTGVYVWDIQTVDLVVNYFELSDNTSDISHANIADFDGDGNTDSTEENPTYTFTVAGNFNVQLRVDDGNNGIGVNNLTIYAGNNLTEFTFKGGTGGPGRNGTLPNTLFRSPNFANLSSQSLLRRRSSVKYPLLKLRWVQRNFLQY